MMIMRMLVAYSTAINLLLFISCESVIHAASSASGNGSPPVATTPATPSSDAPTSASSTTESAAFVARHKTADHHGYVVKEETVVYHRWRTILQRVVECPNGRTAHFDVVGQAQGPSAVLIFAYNTTSQTATLIREYHPGCHKLLYGVAAGLVEEEKHDANVTLAAQYELEEECHLSGGRWFRLTDEPLAMDKYASTMVHAYLVLDPEHVEDPRPLDDEEEIEIMRGLTVEQVMERLRGGEMNIVGAYGTLLALQKLRELGEIK